MFSVCISYKQILTKGSADKSAWFPKLNIAPVYEIRLGIVRYNYLTSFGTLGHTFPTFLPPQLSAWSSYKKARFLKIRRRILGKMQNTPANFLSYHLSKYAGEFCIFPKIRRRIFKNFNFFEELHFNIWGWRKIGIIKVQQ